MTADDGLRPWMVYGKRTIYDNRWVRLDLVGVEPPNEPRFEHHVVRLHRAAVAAVFDDADRVLMLWRYRFVPQQWGWELPGGLVNEGEDSAKTAAREVEEETGWRPTALRHLLTYQPLVGMVDAPHDLFVGRGARYVGEPAQGDETGRVAWVPLGDVEFHPGTGHRVSCREGSVLTVHHAGFVRSAVAERRV